MNDLSPIFSLGAFTAIIVGAGWAIVKYVNDKFSKAEAQRREGDLIIHNRLNDTDAKLNKEIGYREAMEKYAIEPNCRK